MILGHMPSRSTQQSLVVQDINKIDLFMNDQSDRLQFIPNTLKTKGLSVIEDVTAWIKLLLKSK